MKLSTQKKTIKSMRVGCWTYVCTTESVAAHKSSIRRRSSTHRLADSISTQHVRATLSRYLPITSYLNCCAACKKNPRFCFSMVVGCCDIVIVSVTCVENLRARNLRCYFQWSFIGLKHTMYHLNLFFLGEKH